MTATEELEHEKARADEAERKIAAAIKYLEKRSWSNGVIPTALNILGYQFPKIAFDIRSDNE